MMNASLKLVAAAALLATASSCSSFLDINTNPNALTGASVTPDNVLAQALTVTAAYYTGFDPSFNSYASWAAGYWGKSGVVSGYGEEITYNYATNWPTTQSLFNNVYDNLEDYQFIVNQGANYPNHAAIANIMKVYNFLLLVDEYGDVPYSQALQGAANITPTYDKAADIYKDLIVQLSAATTSINASTSSRAVGTEDVVFGGNMANWKKFANSLKLRILMRESQTGDATLDAYVKAQLATVQASTDGFITTDVVAQPTYTQVSGQQNPFYNRYAYTAAGAGATQRQYQIPTQYIIDQYRLNNDPRLTNFYTLGSRTVNGVTTQEYVGAKPGEQTSPGTSGNVIASFHQGADKAAPVPPKGFFKGPNAPTILMMNAELLFLKAEAETRGLFTGGDAMAQTDYQNGIIAAFQTAYRLATVPVAVPAAPASSTATGLPEYNTYIAANTANPLVAYDKATVSGSLGKQAVILYQKYLAMNLLGSTEAWDDYRRAAQPKLNASGTKDGYPVSSQSSSSRLDNLPTRVLYPQTEYSTNATNVAATGNPNQFTKIFWDVVD